MGSVRYTIEDNVVKEIHKIIVHRFNISDFEDPDLHAAAPLWEWQQSEAGQFIMQHAIDKPEWHKQMDPMMLSYRYSIVVELEAKKLTEFYLRFGKANVYSN
jgi:hypothetical protein